MLGHRGRRIRRHPRRCRRRHGRRGRRSRSALGQPGQRHAARPARCGQDQRRPWSRHPLRRTRRGPRGRRTRTRHALGGREGRRHRLPRLRSWARHRTHPRGGEVCGHELRASDRRAGRGDGPRRARGRKQVGRLNYRRGPFPRGGLAGPFTGLRRGLTGEPSLPPRWTLPPGGLNPVRLHVAHPSAAAKNGAELWPGAAAETLSCCGCSLRGRSSAFSPRSGKPAGASARK